jgi:hypothetical protein
MRWDGICGSANRRQGESWLNGGFAGLENEKSDHIRIVPAFPRRKTAPMRSGHKNKAAHH